MSVADVKTGTRKETNTNRSRDARSLHLSILNDSLEVSQSGSTLHSGFCRGGILAEGRCGDAKACVRRRQSRHDT